MYTHTHTHTHTLMCRGVCTHEMQIHMTQSITKKLTDRLVEFSRSLEERVHCGLQWYVCVGGVVMYYITFVLCVCAHMCACACSTLCDPMDCSLPGSFVHGIFQARILEQVVISYSRASSQFRIKPTYLVSPALAGKILYHCTT